MWAVTLAQWSPYAVHRMSVNAVQGGKSILASDVI